MKSRSSTIQGIQFLRGIAAMLVVIHHALEMSNGSIGRFSPEWFTKFGAVGVDIFFVISGFIIFQSTFWMRERRLKPWVFLFQRVIRIYPFYWLCLFSMCCLFFLGFMKSHDLNLSKFLIGLSLFPVSEPLINVSWTLSYEMYFYFIFSFSLLVSEIFFSFLFCVGIVVALHLLGHVAAIDFLANPVAFEFIVGMVAVYLYRSGYKASLYWASLAVLIIGIGAWLIESPSTAGLEGISRVLVWGIPAFFIVSYAARFQASNRYTHFLCVLGDASYSIYLTHVFVMIGYGWLIKNTMIGNMQQVPIVIFIVFLSAAIGLMSHFLIEYPLNYWIKRKFEGLLKAVHYYEIQPVGGK